MAACSDVTATGRRRSFSTWAPPITCSIVVREDKCGLNCKVPAATTYLIIQWAEEIELLHTHAGSSNDSGLPLSNKERVSR